MPSSHLRCLELGGKVSTCTTLQSPISRSGRSIGRSTEQIPQFHVYPTRISARNGCLCLYVPFAKEYPACYLLFFCMSQHRTFCCSRQTPCAGIQWFRPCVFVCLASFSGNGKARYLKLPRPWSLWQMEPRIASAWGFQRIVAARCGDRLDALGASPFLSAIKDPTCGVSSALHLAKDLYPKLHSCTFTDG